MKYAMVINELSSFRIGLTVRVKGRTSDNEYALLEDGEYCDCIRSDCLRFIDKKEFDLLEAKTEAIKKYISIMDDEDNLDYRDKLEEYLKAIKSI